MDRKIAFCVKNWSSDATLYSWTWAKQYFLRKNIDAAGVETLNPSDKLYVVHVKQQTKEKDKAWSAGGPLLPGLEVALIRYPHSIIELEGGHTYSALLDFTERANIDILILGGKEANSNFLNKLVQARPLSQQLNSKAACLIIRPASARNDKMRINSQRNLGQAMEQAAGGVGPRSSLSQSMKPKVLTAETDQDERRQLVIAYDATEEGRQMLIWATKFCLAADDELHLVHYQHSSYSLCFSCICRRATWVTKFCLSAGNELHLVCYQVSQKGRKQHSDEEGDACLDEEDLSGYSLKQHTSLKGDAKQEICDFCEAQSADLLIVTSTIRGRLRKALSPMGGVSSQLVLEAPCPVLVLPTQGMHEHSASFGNSGELQGTYEVSTSPDSQGERSPQGKGPFYRLGSMKTRSVELPRRQRSSSYSAITPQSSTGTQGLTPLPTPPQLTNQGFTQPHGQSQGQPQGQYPAPSTSQVSGMTSSGMMSSGSGLLQTSGGAWVAGGGGGGVGQGPRPSQPVSPRHQQAAADGVAQEQREPSPSRPGALPAHNRNLTQQASISANIDLIAKLRRQLEERDAEIAELKNVVRELQLSQQYASGNSGASLSSQPLLS